ncbi:MAG: hypothetical protein ABI905_14320 [Betaproteobacteria bacterium]
MRAARATAAGICAWFFIAAFSNSTLAAMAPANAVIGNQATATYVDSTSTTRTSTSNTVQTTVLPVKSYTLTTNGARNAPPNAQVCYPHTITNTGNGQDTYALNVPATGGMFAHTALAYYMDADQNGLPDSGSPITSSGPIPAGTTFNFVVCGTTPAAATLGQQGTIIVSVTDTNSPAPTTLTNTDTTTIQPASVTINKKLSSVPPPGYTPVVSGASPNAGPLFIILEYANNGSLQADALVLRDILPSGMLYVPGSGRWSGSGVAVLTDVAGGDPAGITYQAPPTATSGTVDATIATVAGSSSGNVYFQVTIAGGLAPSPASQAPTANTGEYRYSYQFGGSTYCVNGTTTSIIAAPNAGASCPIANGISNTVTYTVVQTAGVSVNGSNTSTALAASEPVTVASAAPGQTISWTDVIWNTGGGTDSFDISLLNTPLNGSGCAPGNAGANACTFPANTNFSILSSNGMTALLDTNGNGTPDTGSIPQPTAGACPAPFIVSTSAPLRCGYSVVITATLPATAVSGNNGGNGYRIVVQGTSFFNTTISDTAPDVLTSIGTNTVDLTNNVSIAGGANVTNGLGPDDLAVKTTNIVTPSGAATTATTFRLFVNNTSSAAAVYDLGFSWISVPAGLNATPTGWSVIFRNDGGGGACATTSGGAIVSTGPTPIPAAGSRLICAEVTVPAVATPSAAPSAGPTAAPAGNYVISFSTTQQGAPSVTDSKRDQVTVLPLHAVTLTPNGAQNSVPGASVSYTHVLTNSGNTSENFTFPTPAFLTNSQSPAFSWTSVAYVDTNMNGTLEVGVDAPIVPGTTTFALPPNSSQVIFVRVTAPPASGSPPNVTTLTATYNSGASSVSATDTTTLTDGVKLDKYQQLPGGNGSCLITPATTITLGAPNAPWSNATIIAGPNTAPGKCIAYLIVGTNTSAVNVTNINMSDVIPASTKLETGCGAPVATGPVAITGGPYASGFTGSVAAQSSPTPATPLPPGTSFTIQFCVKINDT